MRILNAYGFLLALLSGACAASGEPSSTAPSEGVATDEGALVDSDGSSVHLDLARVGRRPSPALRPALSCGGLMDPGCPEGSYCSFPPEALCGSADAPGTCAVRPEACTDQYDPVCGCDDHTYGNACSAASSGVSVAHAGPCDPPSANEGESCGGFRMGPSPVCAEGLYCNYTIGDSCGWADAPGTCARKPTVCPRNYAPVCGCDGTTYSNACIAASAGVAVLHEGSCMPPSALPSGRL